MLKKILRLFGVHIPALLLCGPVVAFAAGISVPGNVPPDNTITTAKIVDGAVLSTKITDTNYIDAQNYATLALAAAAATNKTLVIKKAFTLASNLTFTAGTSVDIHNGGVISCGSYTITVPTIKAGDYQIFSGCSGKVAGIRSKINAAWFGASSTESAENNTTAINAAILAGIGTTHATTVTIPIGTHNHNGLTIPDGGVSLEGVAPLGSILNNVGSATHGLNIYHSRGYMNPVTVRNLYFKGTSTGAAILVDSEAKITIEYCYFIDLAGRGILMGDLSDVSLTVIQHNNFQRITSDVIYARTHAARQVNAVRILNNNITQNYSNGINVWANNLTISGNTIQGCSGVGVLLSSEDQKTYNSNASNVSISDTYSEANVNGFIRVEVSIRSGIYSTVHGLSIENNYDLMTAATSSVTSNVTFTNFGTVSMSDPYVKSLRFSNNYLSGDMVKADFGDVVSLDSLIAPSMVPREGDLETDEAALDLNYIHLGLAHLVGDTRTVIQGMFFAKGDFVYTSPTTTSITASLSSSVTITTGGYKYAVFPVSSIVPPGAIIVSMALYVDTDSTNYTIYATMYKKNPRVTGIYSTTNGGLFSLSAQSGSQLIQGPKIDNYVAMGNSANRRLLKNNEDAYIMVTVYGTPGTYFKLGNPILRFN